jgi:hypothetical protein
MIWFIAGIYLIANLPTILEQTNNIRTNLRTDYYKWSRCIVPISINRHVERVEYQNVKPDVNINYQSIGSGGGVKQL